MAPLGAAPLLTVLGAPRILFQMGRAAQRAYALLALACVAACNEPLPPFLQLEDVQRSTAIGTSIGGALAGLRDGTSLVLRNNGGDDLTISADGAFVFPKKMINGDRYEVSVATQPIDQSCAVQAGTGIAGAEDVSDVSIQCTRIAFSLIAVVTGATGTMILQNKGANLSVDGSGEFPFPTKLPAGGTYNVSIFSPPPNHTCTLSGGNGAIVDDDVRVTIACTLNTYQLGGRVFGASFGALTLQNTNGETLSLGSDGNFSFPTKIPTGELYDIELVQGPPNRTCTISGGSGFMSTADIDSIVVTCKLNVGTFTKTFRPTSFTGNYWPLTTDASFRHQNLYLPSEINGSGRITALQWQLWDDTSFTTNCPNTTIRLAHTTNSELSGTFSSNLNRDTPVVVLQNGTITQPAGAADTWFEVPLTTPFEYNGVENLVVEIERQAPCDRDGVYMVSKSSGSIRRAARENNTDPTASWNDYNQFAMRFVFTGGEDKAMPVDDGGSVNAAAVAGENIAPSASGRTQILVLADAIVGSGPITGIGLPVLSSNSAATATYKVRLAHVSAATTALSTTFADNLEADTKLVADGTIDIPADAGTWWLPFNNHFAYDGTRHLLIDVEATVDTPFDYVLRAVSSDRLLWNTDASQPTGTAGPFVAFPQLRFNGASLQVVEAYANYYGNYDFFLGDSTGGVASLFHATELGTGGLIRAISCRVASSQTWAATYPSYRVLMSHSTVAGLSDSATDLVAATTVFNGAFSIPDTMRRGDWIRIPLSAPFHYDGTSKLIVWMGSTSAPNTEWNYCSLSAADARHTANAASGVPGATFDSFLDQKTNMRFEIDR